MIADLIARAAALSVAYWLTMAALVVLTGALVVLWLASWGAEWDREHDR